MGRSSIEEIAAKLKAEIIEASFKNGERLPSAAQVMEKLGGSPVTCMKAYKLLEREGIVECVQGKGVFLKNASFAETAKRIGVLTMDYGGAELEKEVVFGQFASAATDELRRAGAKIVRLCKEDVYAEDGEETLAGLDGLIATIGCIDPRTTPKLLACGKPVVLIQNEKPMPFKLHQVVPDLYDGYSKAIRLTLKLGVENLTTVAIDIGTHQDRMEIFFRALESVPEAKRLRVRKLEERRVMADMGRLAGAKAGERILAEKLPMEMIFCPSDYLAFGLVDRFQAEGLKPGNDFRLISYDNFEGNGLTPYGEPLLSCVDFPRATIARKAARLVLNAPSDGSTCIVRIPCEMIQRRSACEMKEARP